MAIKEPTPVKGKAGSSKDLMAFSFSDTIAGYVKRYDRNADKFTLETTDGRLFAFEVKSRGPANKATVRVVEQFAERCGTAVPFAYRVPSGLVTSSARRDDGWMDPEWPIRACAA